MVSKAPETITLTDKEYLALTEALYSIEGHVQDMRDGGENLSAYDAGEDALAAAYDRAEKGQQKG